MLFRSYSPDNYYGYLANHFFAAAGYRFELEEGLDVEPAVFLRKVSPVPAQMDFTLRFIYEDKVWLGVQYRTDDAATVFLGYDYKNRISFGYSYDFTTSDLKNYSSGTNEFMLAYKFGNIEPVGKNSSGTGLF